MNQTLISTIRSYHKNFDENVLSQGLSLFEKKRFAAKSLISKAGDTADYLFFAENSITRCFYNDTSGEDQTLWMKPEQTFIAEFKSFTTSEKSMFNLQFYEDTEVWMISRANLMKLFRESQDWALFGIHLMESVHVTLIDVFVNLLANDATRNYQYIVR